MLFWALSCGSTFDLTVPWQKSYYILIEFPVYSLNIRKIFIFPSRNGNHGGRIREKREKVCDVFCKYCGQCSLVTWNWVATERGKEGLTESCSLSHGQMLLPFSETGKTRKAATYMRQKENKSSILARLWLRYLFRHSSVCVK